MLIAVGLGLGLESLAVVGSESGRMMNTLDF